MEIISVSQYLDRLNISLEKEKAKIQGEITEVQEYPGRTYLYFSVKDAKDQSKIKCFMWKNDYRISGLEIKDGMEVVVTAYPKIYKPNGSVSLQVELIELVGEGALKIAYEKLKQKLELEGLFAIERKRTIPDYPHHIGVITSKSGAVINDFLSNIGKFGYDIMFVDSKVEGQDAIKDLLSAIKTLKGKDIDLLVIMRGGGSLESFQAFNNEILCRAIADFPVPVLTGIGHDKDAPLASLVSDKNVSTPTAVANLLNSSWIEALSKVNLYQEKIMSQFQRTVLDVFRYAEDTMLRGVDRIESSIKSISDNISLSAKDLNRGFSLLSSRTEDFLRQAAKSIELSNPERQLAHGYSIVRSGGKVIRYVREVKSKDNIDITVSDGTIRSKVI